MKMLMTEDKQPNMNEAVEQSVSTNTQGTDDPESILPIADAKHGGEARVVGFMYRGNGYGSNTAWITCDQDDLMDLER